MSIFGSGLPLTKNEQTFVAVNGRIMPDQLHVCNGCPKKSGTAGMYAKSFGYTEHSGDSSLGLD